MPANWRDRCIVLPLLEQSRRMLGSHFDIIFNGSSGLSVGKDGV
jgi:hypothetical protein